MFKVCYVFLGILGLLACTNSSSTDHDLNYGDYQIQPVDIRNVKITDDFWLPIVRRVQEKTIEFALEKCEQEGRFENFLIAGGLMEGETRGFMPFDDTDVYKIIEGASNSLISSPNDQLESLLDSLIAIIATGQEEDGYLTTWRTINPSKPPASWVNVDQGVRWESLAASHELYNAGHLYEAAAVHYGATGKSNFLDIATKNADLMVETFGPGKIETVPGHQIIETGLIKLFRITGKESYLELARYFLDGRGNPAGGRELFGSYSQDHLPVTDQNEVVGHAVRAVYMYAGMTDIAAIYRDQSYEEAIDALWTNMVEKKMYITGGIGASRNGEAFGENYDLPNMTAYSETCAAIGDVYWNHRLFMLKGQAAYYDVIERTLYNGLISGLSLDGEKFFYPNALESDGKYEFNMGKCTRQSWFDCSCCPTNLIRFIPSIPGLIYARKADSLYVNLYASSTAEVKLDNGSLSIRQQTNYPWKGTIEFNITAEAEATLFLRIPGWARNEVLPGGLYSYANNYDSEISISANGKQWRGSFDEGYAKLDVKKGDTKIVLHFPMEVREVLADPQVEENHGKTALEYGPIVYAFEEADNADNFEQLLISNEVTYAVEYSDILEGVNLIQVMDDKRSFTAIPYFTWSNRGVGKMKVWVPKS